MEQVLVFNVDFRYRNPVTSVETGGRSRVTRFILVLECVKYICVCGLGCTSLCNEINVDWRRFEL